MATVAGLPNNYVCFEQEPVEESGLYGNGFTVVADSKFRDAGSSEEQGLSSPSSNSSSPSKAKSMTKSNNSAEEVRETTRSTATLRSGATARIELRDCRFLRSLVLKSNSSLRTPGPTLCPCLKLSGVTSSPCPPETPSSRASKPLETRRSSGARRAAGRRSALQFRTRASSLSRRR